MRKPTYANVASTLALLVALSGAAYAAANLEPDSVATKHLKDEAVTTPKLDNNSVKSGKIDDGTVAPGDLKAASRRVHGYVRVYSGDIIINGQQTGQPKAYCPEGKVALGGGWYSSSYLIEVAGSRPEIDNENGRSYWVADIWNPSSDQISVGSWAVCANGVDDEIRPEDI